MTLQGLNDVKHWRDRAAEMRVLSGEMKDFDAQTLMLKLANDYDKLADRAEDRAARNVPGRPSRHRKPANGTSSNFAPNGRGLVEDRRTES